MKTTKIILYDEPLVPEIKIKKNKKFLTEIFPVKIDIRGNFLQHVSNNLLDEIMKTRISNLKNPLKIKPT